jgi:hypothetical protein
MESVLCGEHVGSIVTTSYYIYHHYGYHYGGARDGAVG